MSHFLCRCGGGAVLLVLAALPSAPGPGGALRADQAPAEVSAGGITLRSVSVTLPPGDAPFPAGPGADAIGNNCLACHSAGMVLRQPPLGRAGWEAEVAKMRNVYKAPVAAEDVPAIVAYLVAQQGG